MKDLILWEKIKKEAKKKFLVFPSAYASFWMANQYKKKGGQYDANTSKKNSTLFRWKMEKWVNVCDHYKPCGRSKASLFSKNYPLCRPSIRINSKTPKTIHEIPKTQLKKMCLKKRSLNQGIDKKPSRVYF